MAKTSDRPTLVRAPPVAAHDDELSAALGWASTRRLRNHGEGVVPPYVVLPLGSARLLARI